MRSGGRSGKRRAPDRRREGIALSTRAIAAYGPAAVWAALLFFVGSRSDTPGPSFDVPLDKVAHFLFYGVLGALAAWGWVKAGRRPGALWVILAALLVGACDEMNQSTVPERSSEVADFIADAAGVALGFAVVKRRAAKRGGTGTGGS